MEVFYHLLYEHGRGLRDLALYTIDPSQEPLVEADLLREGVAYLFRPIEDGRVVTGHLKTYHLWSPQNVPLCGLSLG